VLSLAFVTIPSSTTFSSNRRSDHFAWPAGKALDHWLLVEPVGDEEKVMAGRSDANLPALLTKDVPGG